MNIEKHVCANSNLERPPERAIRAAVTFLSLLNDIERTLGLIMKLKLATKSAAKHNKLLKCPTGIKAFDDITEGGLPKNRTTLVSGNAGSGKTLFGIDFLIKGATDYNEPGVLMSFEETEDELYTDVTSLNMDLPALVSR